MSKPGPKPRQNASGSWFPWARSERCEWYTPASGEWIMGASRIEFRARMLINAIIILVGFWSPWTASRSAWAGFGPHVSLLEWLALHLSRLELLAFSAAAPVVIGSAAL